MSELRAKWTFHLGSQVCEQFARVDALDRGRQRTPDGIRIALLPSVGVCVGRTLLCGLPANQHPPEGGRIGRISYLSVSVDLTSKSTILAHRHIFFESLRHSHDGARGPPLVCEPA